MTGTAGRSAQAEYRRRKVATDWRAAIAPLTFLAAAVVFIGVRFNVVLAVLLVLVLAVVLTPAALLGVQRRRRGAPGSGFRLGAKGERSTAGDLAVLERRGLQGASRPGRPWPAREH